MRNFLFLSVCLPDLVIPCLLQISSQFAACKKLSLIVSDHNRVLSTHLVLLGVEDVISLYMYLPVYSLPQAM